MRPTRSLSPVISRHGITLMEVLISIGIVAIGLTSAMSLIPAGKSESSKALVYDRASAMAMNSLSDAITFGLTRPDSFVTANPASATMVFDPANVVTWPAAATAATLNRDGVLATSAASGPASLTVEKLFSQGRDDVVYNPPATADDTPSNRFINGIRGYEGRMTSMIALTEADSGSPPLVAGDLATLSAIVFHNRDTNTPTVSATITSAGYLQLTTPLPADRTFKSVVRTGIVVCYENSGRLRFAQLSMAAVDMNSNDAYVTFSGRPIPSPPPTAIFILVDSVGLAEQTVSLEGPGPYGL